jgi:transcription elongation GreA/GreB family factor
MNEEVQKLVDAGKLNAGDGKKLSTLEPGVFCLHKSWGVGKVAAWDFLGDRIVIDFEDKKEHPLKLSFAITSLSVLPEDHFLAKRFSDLESMKKVAREQPATLVEMALTSVGGKMSLNDLDDMIKGRIVSDGEYKKWWDGAKKALKPVRHIVVPSKRTEPLVLRNSEESPSAGLVQGFLKARDLKGKLAALKAITADIDLFVDPQNEIIPVFQDLSDAARRSARLQLKEGLHLLLARDELLEEAKLGDAPIGSMKVSDLLSESREQLADAVSGLPVGLLGRMYRAFPTAFPDGGWVQECLNHLTKTGGRAVAEIASVLNQHGEVEVLAEFLKKAVRNRRLSADLLIWICKERKGLAQNVFSIDLGNAILDAVQADHLEGGPKRTGRLQDAFTDDPELLGQLVADSDEQDVRLLAKRILNFNVFDELTRRSLMAKIIKQRPALQDMVDEKAGQKEDNSLIVSWESLERKKKELEEIVHVKIPQNKKDIEIAREYGDLRENFEYKSAKQQQAVLQRMQGEYQRDLDRAIGTDFANVNSSTVGIGTLVDIEDTGSGAKETYTILGAWDGDVEKNIISYLSEAAKALIGRAIGDEIELPSEDANVQRKVKILDIRAYKAA